MNKSSQNVANKEVSERLLDIAERLFSQKGFDGTNIRDLTRGAGCNIAAVNYHFGGKENLYWEIFRRRCLALRDVRIDSIDKVMSENGGNPGLEKLLRQFANAFIEPLIDESAGRRFIILMMREMLNPRLPRDLFIREVIVPVTGALQDALMKLCPYLNATKARYCMYSVIGQLVQVIRMKMMLEEYGTGAGYSFDLTEAVDHIVKFSAVGIRAYANGKDKCSEV